jgi:adenylate cyclase
VAVAPNNADNIAYAACQAAWAPAIAVEAEAWIRRAMQLNPAHPSWYDWCLADVMWTQRRYAEAAVSYERAPPTVDAHAMAAAGWALAGEQDRAAAALARATAADSGFSTEWFRTILVVHDDFWADIARGLRLVGAPDGAVAEKAEAATTR